MKEKKISVSIDNWPTAIGPWVIGWLFTTGLLSNVAGVQHASSWEFTKYFILMLFAWPVALGEFVYTFSQDILCAI